VRDFQGLLKVVVSAPAGTALPGLKAQVLSILPNVLAVDLDAPDQQGGNVTPFAEREGLSVHALLEREAARQSPGQHGLIALDWWNGNRSVLVDANLSGVVVGMTLATRAPDLYRALIEATAFGTRVIVENFEANGVPVHELVIAGGLKRNRLLMQIYADVTGRPLSVLDAEQGPALGSAMHAAVAAGVYPDIQAAATAMGRVTRAAYLPVPEHVAVYDRLYAEYVTLHDYFGRGLNDVMKRLKSLAHAAGQQTPAAQVPQQVSA